MKLNKVWLKILGLIALASPIVYAGECKELEEYFGDNEYVDIGECKENADGRITELGVGESMNSMSVEYMDKILSYDTITTFSYIKDVNYEVQVYHAEVIPTKIDKLTNLKKLKNLKSLTIGLGCSASGGTGTKVYCAYGNIVENTLKDLTSLEYLKLNQIEISQSNINEMSTLTNLQTLIIINSPLNEEYDFKILNKLKNVKYLKIDRNVISGLVNAIKSVKELVLTNGYYTNYGEKIIIDDLPNVEKIDWFVDFFDVSSLGNLNKLEELNLDFGRYEDLSSLENLKQIKKLTIAKNRISPGSAGNPPEEVIIKFSEEHQLKELSISTVKLSDSNLEEIMKLKNLEKLTFNDIDVSELSEEGTKLLKSLESRCSLEVYYYIDFKFHKSIKNEPCNKSSTSSINSSTVEILPTTTNVEKEVITSTTETLSTTTITKTITKTTVIIEPTTSTPDKQALIDDDKTIESDIEKDKTIESDIEVEDKTNESDIEVDEKNIDKSVESEDEPEENVNISTNHKCGKSDGKCPKGECCSKYGWCGKSDKHCLVSQGCQSEFGKCEEDIKISTNHKCGKSDGKCPKGECCSKYGWCGKSDKHCLVSQGCQSEFGKCEEDIKISTNHKCGKSDGKCPKGECCSKYGWCGKSDKHCLVSQGCQSEFGKCEEDIKISTNHKCGKSDGKCPKGECCSKYGWCGKSDKHCLVSQGCQSEFGECK